MGRREKVEIEGRKAVRQRETMEENRMTAGKIKINKEDKGWKEWDEIARGTKGAEERKRNEEKREFKRRFKERNEVRFKASNSLVYIGPSHST